MRGAEWAAFLRGSWEGAGRSDAPGGPVGITRPGRLAWRVPGRRAPRGPSGGCPRPEPALAPPAPCSPELGTGVRLFLSGRRNVGGGRRSVSLFRENLCGPGVLPELLLLLGSLPKWGETGNSPRCWERYGRRGGDGGDRLPEGPRARCERLGGRGARTRRRPPGPATRAPAGAGRGSVLRRGSRSRPPGRRPGTLRVGHRGPSGGTRSRGRAAERTSLAVGAPLSAPHGSCGRIALRPQSVCVHVSEALVAGGCRHWLGPQRSGARSPAPTRQRAAPPAGTALWPRIPFRVHQRRACSRETLVVRLGGKGRHRGLRPAGWAGRAARSSPHTRAVVLGLKQGAHTRAR